MLFPNQTLVRLSDALDELKTRAKELADGSVSKGTRHAIKLLLQAIDQDISTEQNARAAHGGQAIRLSEGLATLDPRDAFVYRLSEDGDGVVDADGDEGEDDVEAISHDMDVLSLATDDLVARGLVSRSTHELARHTARLLRADLEAANTPETMQASEQDDNPDLWPAADRLARRRYGTSLDRIRLTDPEMMDRLLHEAEANRRRR